MTWDLATRLDTLGTRMKELNDNSFTYTRDSTDIAITNFTVTGTDVQQIGEAGIVLVTEKGQNFTFDTSDLSTLSPVEPQIGDTLTWGSLVFTVFAIEDKCFRYTTGSRLRITVFTKQTT